MKKRIAIWGLAFAAALGAWGDVQEALRGVRAPGGEFVRMPAKYVLQKLESVARNSGDAELSAFVVRVRVPALRDQRVNINMESMNLLEALESIATSTGSKLVFEEGVAALVEPSEGAETDPETEEDSPAEAERDKNRKVEFSDVDTALVFVNTGVASGSGFVAEMDEKVYVFSNQHNFMAARKIELRAMHGGLLEFEAFEFNRARDLVRFRLKETSLDELGVLKFAPVSPTIGQKVAVFGNSAGKGVATELRGAVLGVGPRAVEVSATIVPGNSGSPILDADGAVIGVATYLTLEQEFDKDDPRASAYKGTRFKKPRRYGARVPTDGWIEVDPRKFLAQTYALEDSKTVLRVTDTLTRFWLGDEDYEADARIIMDVYGTSERRVKSPFVFHDARVEEETRLMVKAFKRNYEEFVEIVQDMELNKSSLARLRKELESDKSTHKIQRVDHHIRTSMLRRVKRFQDQLKQHSWMSGFLETSAAPLEALASELVRVLDSEGDLQFRIKAVM